MARRLFFVDQVRNGSAEIGGEDASHLVKVLRVEPGQRYEISDNRQLYLAEVESARKSSVEFRVVEKLPMRDAPVRIHLHMAIIKFDHFEWVLEKATELDVERITPVIAQRTERGLEQAAHKRSSRWRKILKESSQQCRRWRLPELTELEEFARALQRRDQFRYFFDESAAIPIMTQLPPRCTPDDTVSVLIGPEGGWTDPERQLAADAQWIPVSLGGRILRAETAATASLAVLQAAWSSSLPSSSTT